LTLHARSHIIQGYAESQSKNEAESNAQNEFRRELLSTLTSHYQSQLRQYYQIFQGSRQSFHRSVVDELVNLAQRNTAFERGLYRSTVSLPVAEFENFMMIKRIERVPINNDDYITYLIVNIDNALLSPDPSMLSQLDLLHDNLRKCRLFFPEKVLSYQRDVIEIVFQTPATIRPVLEFRYLESSVEKTAGDDNRILLRVMAATNRTPGDFRLERNSGDASIFYRYNVEKTFGLNQLKHPQFFANFISRVLPDVSGVVNILSIPDSKFFITSENFLMGIDRVTQIVQSKNWGIGTAHDHTHRVEIIKEVVSERSLNIGTFYVKAYLVVNTYDNNGILLESKTSKEEEAIDKDSLENCHQKVNNQLMRSLDGMF
jgi:hypothetical protein